MATQMVGFVWGRKFDYSREDARLRGIFLGSSGICDASAIERRFQCTRGDAWRIVAFRSIACLELQSAFANEGARVTWRQVWRVASTWPYEPELQGEALAHLGILPHRAKKRGRWRSRVTLPR